MDTCPATRQPFCALRFNNANYLLITCPSSLQAHLFLQHGWVGLSHIAAPSRDTVAISRPQDKTFACIEPTSFSIVATARIKLLCFLSSFLARQKHTANGECSGTPQYNGLEQNPSKLVRTRALERGLTCVFARRSTLPLEVVDNVQPRQNRMAW